MGTSNSSLDQRVSGVLTSRQDYELLNTFADTLQDQSYEGAVETVQDKYNMSRQEVEQAVTAFESADLFKDGDEPAAVTATGHLALINYEDADDEFFQELAETAGPSRDLLTSAGRAPAAAKILENGYAENESVKDGEYSDDKQQDDAFLEQLQDSLYEKDYRLLSEVKPELDKGKNLTEAAETVEWLSYPSIAERFRTYKDLGLVEKEQGFSYSFDEVIYELLDGEEIEKRSFLDNAGDAAQKAGLLADWLNNEYEQLVSILTAHAKDGAASGEQLATAANEEYEQLVSDVTENLRLGEQAGAFLSGLLNKEYEQLVSELTGYAAEAQERGVALRTILEERYDEQQEALREELEAELDGDDFQLLGALQPELEGGKSLRKAVEAADIDLSYGTVAAKVRDYKELGAVKKESGFSYNFSQAVEDLLEAEDFDDTTATQNTEQPPVEEPQQEESAEFQQQALEENKTAENQKQAKQRERKALKEEGLLPEDEAADKEDVLLVDEGQSAMEADAQLREQAEDEREQYDRPSTSSKNGNGDLHSIADDLLRDESGDAITFEQKGTHYEDDGIEDREFFEDSLTVENVTDKGAQLAAVTGLPEGVATKAYERGLQRVNDERELWDGIDFEEKLQHGVPDVQESLEGGDAGYEGYT